MNKEYMNVRDGAFLNVNQKMKFKEEHIDPNVLKLENEIEIMEEELSAIEKELERVSEKNSNLDLIEWIFINIFMVLACKFLPTFLLGTDKEYIASLGKTVSMSSNLMKAIIPIFNIILLCGGISPFKYFKNKKIRQQLNAQKEYLTKSIAESKSKLATMKSKIKEVSIDKEIQSLESYNKNYRNELQTKLDFIKNYQKYKKRFLEAYNNGTLGDYFKDNTTYSNLEVDFVENIIAPDITDDYARKRTKN